MSRTSIINYDVLWDRISNFARKAGRVSTKPVLILWFVLKSKETSRSDKMLIISTLSYHNKVCKNITPEMEAKVDDILDRWFPEYTAYELIEE